VTFFCNFWLQNSKLQLNGQR